MNDRSDRLRHNLFAGPYLDRGGDKRKDRSWVEDAFAAANARFVPVWQALNLVSGHPEPRALLLSRDEASGWFGHAPPIFLGQFRGHNCFAVEVPREPAALAEASFVDLRTAGGMLEASEAGLLAYARALVYWRSRHRYCGSCSAPTRPDEGGQVMVCTREGCGAQFFPRVDPAIIVLVTDGERALLGRQAGWPEGRYSTLAGFVEPGESLEDAVVREVGEEANVVVTDLVYHSSQPWPFPSSLMVGYHARTDASSEPVAGEELEDVRFVSRDDIAKGRILLPSRLSISYQLVRQWFDSAPGRSLATELGIAGGTGR